MPNKRNDQLIERTISSILSWGVHLASLVLVIGGVNYLVHHGMAVPNDRFFHGEAAELRTLIGIVRGAILGDGESQLQLGVLILFATPIARVAFSAFAFAKQREYIYGCMCLIVLLVIGYGFWGTI